MSIRDNFKFSEDFVNNTKSEGITNELTNIEIKPTIGAIPIDTQGVGIVSIPTEGKAAIVSVKVDSDADTSKIAIVTQSSTPLDNDALSSVQKVTIDFSKYPTLNGMFIVNVSN